MGETVEFEKNDDEELTRFVYENIHKVRPCDMYEMEYKECKSLKGRFQQYYVYGEYLDCSKWKEDLKNCDKFHKSKMEDFKAIASVIQHENERFEKRMKGHLENDVWERRTEPPSDWNSKLPDWLEKRQEHAFPEKEAIEPQGCVIF